MSGSKKQQARSAEEKIVKAWDKYNKWNSSGKKKEKLLAEAESYIQLALEECSDFPPANALSGYIEMDKGNIDQMEAYFLKAIDHIDDPLYREINGWNTVLSTMIATLKENERAGRLIEEMYKKKADYFILEALVRIYFKLEKKSEALDVISKHMTRFPDDKNARELYEKALSGKLDTYSSRIISLLILMPAALSTVLLILLLLLG